MQFPEKVKILQKKKGILFAFSRRTHYFKKSKIMRERFHIDFPPLVTAWLAKGLKLSVVFWLFLRFSREGRNGARLVFVSADSAERKKLSSESEVES